MLQSISSGNQAMAAVAPASGGILASQLNRYETQLADWCHCPSGKTPDGQKKIAELQDKAAAVKAQLQKIETARARQKDQGSPTTADPRPAKELSLVGSLVDTTA
jgi:hypothetical protein